METLSLLQEDQNFEEDQPRITMASLIEVMKEARRNPYVFTEPEAVRAFEAYSKFLVTKGKDFLVEDVARLMVHWDIVE